MDLPSSYFLSAFVFTDVVSNECVLQPHAKWSNYYSSMAIHQGATRDLLICLVKLAGV